MRSFVLLLVALLHVSACATRTPDAPTGPVNAQVVLAPGQTTDLAGAAIRLRFVAVTGDSRCPGDAICIQGGDATVRIEVLPSSGGQATYDLHTGNLQPAHHGDLTIALVELAPYPFASRPFPPSDYRATLKITR
jgi:hypothetical protein